LYLIDGVIEMTLEADPHQSGRKAKERVQLDFSPEALKRLEQLREKVGASTRAEVIRQALRLYEWFIEETDSDTMILLSGKDGEILSKFRASLLHNETHPR
jgi:hypothetical protein